MNYFSNYDHREFYFRVNISIFTQIWAFITNFGKLFDLKPFENQINLVVNFFNRIYLIKSKFSQIKFKIKFLSKY